MEHIITAGEELRKSFHENGFAFLSSVPQRRIQEMILAMAQSCTAYISKGKIWGL